jgi:ankyrin repeat protein
LASGCCVNARDNGGSTSLMCAAFGGYGDVAMKLLASGADVKIKNSGGYGALDLAARSGLDLRGKLLRFEQRGESGPASSEKQVSTNGAGARR